MDMNYFTLSAAVDVPSPLVHNSITPYEQKVSLTANMISITDKFIGTL